MIRNQVPQAEPQIENPRRLSLPAAAEAVLKHMFPTHQRVVVKAELGSGFSDSRVFVVHPIRDTPELPAVIKMAPVGLVKKEYQAYQEYIRDKLSGAAEIKSEPVSLPGGDWGGLCYHLVGSGIFEIESLYSFCRHANIKDIWHVLEKRLFRRIGPLWRFSHPSPQFNLGASYDPLLPINLLIEPTLPPPRAPLHRLRLGALDSQPLKQGDYVRLEGFMVTEVDWNNQAITLNLPTLTDDQPFSYRLRLQPVETTAPFQVNDVIDSIAGVVTATRYDLLQAQVRRALGQDFVATKTLTLPGDADITLPNPLAVLSDILSVSRHVKVACIHGDLNLENILVDPDTRDVRLIDFAVARQDHVLHDLLRMETGVVTWLLPETLAEAGFPPEIIHDLYQQLYCAARPAGHFSAPKQLHPALRKAFVMLATIREMARECLFDPDDWGEYYQGLTLYLLGALKFKNLDEMPQAPLPKQVAFWGAAAAQKLLQAPPPYGETDWQPLAALIDDLTGQTLGRYEIVERSGEGGMATVYRAHQPRLKRDVAIKVMRPALAADPLFRERFEREAQAIANLHHPNILTVYDYGETKEGQLYLVVEHVRGGTLRERLEAPPLVPPSGEEVGGAMPWQEAVEIVAQVAEALDYAHRRKVIHRDVKPNNILLTRDGRPLLADFGLVRPIRGDRRLTGSGVMLGTPEYMAPEQAQGLELDGRADIYALGVVLFELLTGQHPYTDKSPINVIIKHINEPMPRPSEVNPAVLPLLDEVVAQATAKAPKERYQRAGEMARALRVVLVSAGVPGAVAERVTPPSQAAAPVSPLPSPPRAPRLPPLASRLPPLAKVRVWAVLAALLALAVAVVLIWPRDGERGAIGAVPTAQPGETMILVAEFRAQAGSERFDIGQRIYARLSDELRLLKEQGEKVSVYKVPEVVESSEAAVALGDRYGATTVIWGYYDDIGISANVEAVGVLADNLLSVGLERLNLDLGEVVNFKLYIARDLPEQVSFLTALSLLQAFALQGRPYEVLHYAEMALRSLPNDPEFQGGGEMVYLTQAMLAFFTENPEKAVGLMDRAIAINPDNAQLYLGRGVGYAQMGETDLALADLERAIALDPTDTLAYQMKALLVWEAGDHEVVRGIYERAIELDPNAVLAYHALGNLGFETGDLTLALAAWDKVEEIDSGDKSLPIYRGLIYEKMGQGELAASDYARALEVGVPPDASIQGLRFVLGERIPAYSYLFECTAYWVQGKNEQALESCDKALEVDPTYADALWKRGQLYAARGDWENAVADYTAAIQADARWPWVYYLRAQALVELGRSDEAQADLAQALELEPVEDLRRQIEDFDVEE